MKKIFGLILQITAFFLTAAALSVPLSVLAFHWAVGEGEASPGAVYLLASFLICLIVRFAWAKLPIRKARALWSLIFGMGVYAALGYCAVFGFAKDTLSILTPFRGATANDLLTYVGAGVMLFGVVLGAQGRLLVREGERPARREAEPPRIRPAVTTLKPETVVAHTSAPAAPILGLQPVVAPMPYYLADPQLADAGRASAPAAPQLTAPREKSGDGDKVFTPVDQKQIKYARDKWGNLVVYEEERP